jgi:hypothetical protein
MLNIKHGYETNLNSNLRVQMQSLFVGAVINDTSLINYAETKRLTGYDKGYSYEVLSKIQNRIDTVKRAYPTNYQNFRRELMYQISNPRGESLFFICDRYINSFGNIVHVGSSQVYTAYDLFGSGYDDRY